MARKITVGVLFGGRSAEHEISLRSAYNVIGAINRERYGIVLIGIDKGGTWRHLRPDFFSGCGENTDRLDLRSKGDPVFLSPGMDGRKLVVTVKPETELSIDVFFPVLHGPYGEDGTIQGLLKLLNVPFVGADVLGSAVGMDKDVMKRLLRDAGIPIARFLCFRKGEDERIGFNGISAELGLPLFVKPANLGSSVGVSKVESEREFDRAVSEAFGYDKKIIIEEMIEGREIECSVLGNENPVASLPGEITSRDGFYSYRAKYIDEDGAVLGIPAELPGGVVREVQEYAVRTYRALCCEGMARVDMFLAGGNRVVVNELNTIPGFTRISMYPKLWEISGIPYDTLIDRLIELAMDRFENERILRTSFLTG
ncbi:MAG: D-alanine--D-alanine ligase [Spirochaetales bacterium]|nr:D-alanine--D-alanine ligase [Spirochaetales bacterium]